MRKANLFGQKLEISLLYFRPKNEKKQIYLVRNYKFKPLLYLKRKNEKSKFIWSETRNSNLFYILSLKTRKANLFGQRLEIQTSFIF